MRRLLPLLSCFAVLLSAGTALAQQPPSWALNQNFPNPYCNESSTTRIHYALNQQSAVLLRVWSPDTSVVVRVLVSGTQSSGYHEVIWNGRDEGGSLLENGEYPYSLTASQVGGGPVLFESMLVASIRCVPIDSSFEAWGRIKALFRE